MKGMRSYAVVSVLALGSCLGPHEHETLEDLERVEGVVEQQRVYRFQPLTTRPSFMGESPYEGPPRYVLKIRGHDGVIRRVTQRARSPPDWSAHEVGEYVSIPVDDIRE